MWDSTRATAESLQVEYTNIEPSDTYSLPILKKLNALHDALREYGCGTGIEICGERVVVSDAGQECIFRPSSRGSWPCRIITRVFGDKCVVIAVMCILILLWKEGVITNISINGSDLAQDDSMLGGENKTLWETAWSIMLNMKEV